MKPNDKESRRGNDYWRLDYDTFSLYYLSNRAQAAGYTKCTRRLDAVEVVSRIDRQLPNYRKCSTQELSKFAKDRNTTDEHGLRSRRQMIRDLEAADGNVEFKRFLDLPAELRCRVYSWHMASFPKGLERPAQPPIAQTSRLLRQEAMPLFYQVCQFQLDLGSYARKGERKTRFKFDGGANHFLVSLTPENLAEMRRLRLRVHYQRPYDIDLELKATDEGFEVQVQARIRTPRANEHALKIEEALIGYFTSHKQGKGEGGKQKLTLDDLYRVKKLLEDILIEPWG